MSSKKNSPKTRPLPLVAPVPRSHAATLFSSVGSEFDEKLKRAQECVINLSHLFDKIPDKNSIETIVSAYIDNKNLLESDFKETIRQINIVYKELDRFMGKVLSLSENVMSLTFAPIYYPQKLHAGSVNNMLDDIKNARLQSLKVIEIYKLNRGRPENWPLRNIIENAIELFNEHSPGEFLISLEVGPGKSGPKEYASPGPLFVASFVKAIDPEIPWRKINSILRNRIHPRSSNRDKSEKP